MPEQRSKNKLYIGGWLPMGVAAGIETWLNRPEQKGQEKTRTDFLIEASVNFLADAGIEVTIPTQYVTGRPRKKIPQAAFDLVRETSEPANSAKVQQTADDIETEARRTIRNRRKPAA